MCKRAANLALSLVLVAACARTGGLRLAKHEPMPELAAKETVAFAAKDMALDDEVATEPFNTERYNRIYDNAFRRAVEEPRSTFSVDVDTASYANVRRYLSSWNGLPPKDAVRIEEMINYFSYAYPQPRDEHPFSVNVEIAEAPWNPGHRLARIGIKGREMHSGQRPASNLVFLVDVSGSMSDGNKLPLLKKAFRLMVENLGARDRVALVVYAGAAGLVLPSTPCDDDEYEGIMDALAELSSGGSTNGGAGIMLAYRVAQENFIDGGVNRVVLATDGDFNVGATSDGGLVRLVEEKAKSGVFLTVLGFGTGNLNDSMMEQISNKGNGNYFYIDTLNEARKVLVHELSSTLVTIAKDVKIQVEFNPTLVGAYRLIGYENRVLANQDFNDDTKDAGEIGAGHTVTALYEIVPAGAEDGLPHTDPLKYQTAHEPTAAAAGNDLLTVRLRYKAPDGDVSRLIELAVADAGASLEHASEDFKLATGVAAFGMLLRDSEHKGALTWELALALAEAGRGDDPFGYRGELIELVEKASTLRR